MPQARDSQIPPSGRSGRPVVDSQAERTAPKPRPPARPGHNEGRTRRRITLVVGIAALLFAILMVWIGVSSVAAEPVAVASFGAASRNYDLRLAFQLANSKGEIVRAAGTGVVEIYDGLGNLLTRQQLAFARSDFDRASSAYSVSIPKTRLDVSSSVDRDAAFSTAVAEAADSLKNCRAVLAVTVNRGSTSFSAVDDHIQLYSEDEALSIARRIYFEDAIRTLDTEINEQWPFAVRISDYVMIGDRGWAVVGRSGSEIIIYPYSRIYDWYLLETQDGGESWGIAWKGDAAPLFTVELIDGSKLRISTASGVLEPNLEGELPVVFMDANLEAAIREAIGIGQQPIYPSDLAGLESLAAAGREINDLAGLEHCTSLESLRLQENEIEDISELAGLSNLTVLILHDNQIYDISPLAGLTGLTTLQLSANRIGDIRPLTTLTSLKYLYLSANYISDIAPLRGLSGLSIVMLMNNRITDVSPLVGNTGIGDGDSVGLTENPLSEMSLTAHLPELRGRGVSVIWPVTAPTVVTGPGQSSGLSDGTGPGPSPRPGSGRDSGPGPKPDPDPNQNNDREPDAPQCPGPDPPPPTPEPGPGPDAP